MEVTYRSAASFAAAQQASGLGYSNPVFLADEPTDRPRQRGLPSLIDSAEHFAPLVAAVAIVMARKPGSLRVLDVGGATGGHLGYLEAALQAEFDWTVLETPLYADYGRRWITNRNLHFASSMDEVHGRFDMVYFAGSLPYATDWRSFLAPRDRGTFVLITRTALGPEERTFVQKVRKPDTIYSNPFRVIPKAALLAEVGSTHNMIASWNAQATFCESADAKFWERRRWSRPYPRHHTFEAPAMLFERHR